MKKILLIVRLLVEAMLGLCMAALLLVPEIWSGTSPQQFFIAIILGYLGMPRRYHTSAESQPVHVITLIGLLIVTIVLLIAVLCFRDVFKIVRKLRVSHHGA